MRRLSGVETGFAGTLFGRGSLIGLALKPVLGTSHSLPPGWRLLGNGPKTVPAFAGFAVVKDDMENPYVT